jgi:selenocysteine lyase/cysteine desulfurase
MKRKQFVRSVIGACASLLGYKSLLKISPQSLSTPISKLELGSKSKDALDERFWSVIRDQFPLTHERAYFNTGGLGASPFVVIETVKRKMDELEAISEVGHTEEAWAAVKEKSARVLGCYPTEVTLTGCATEGINIVVNGLPLKRGDEVITTTHEHVGGILPWLARQKFDGIVLKWFEPSTTSREENLERLSRLITSRTKVVSISHITTTTGQQLPVKEIAQIAKDKGLWYFLDGAQVPGMMPVNVRDIGCDFYATSGHKWLLGPKRTGLLYVRKEMLDIVRPIFVGAYSDNGFDLMTGKIDFHPTAQRYEYGTYNVPLMIGLGAAIEFLESIGMENVWRRDQALSTKVYEGLSEIKTVEMLSPSRPEDRGAMITFRMKDMKVEQLQSSLADKYKLRTRFVGEGNLNGLRISTHIYNNFEEVDRLISGVKQMAGQ